MSVRRIQRLIFLVRGVIIITLIKGLNRHVAEHWLHSGNGNVYFTRNKVGELWHRGECLVKNFNVVPCWNQVLY